MPTSGSLGKSANRQRYGVKACGVETPSLADTTGDLAIGLMATSIASWIREDEDGSNTNATWISMLALSIEQIL
jgi:hypothetical protein